MKRVFGSGYKVFFAGIPTKLSSFHNNPNRKKYKRYIQRLVDREFFRGIKDGDDKKLGILMRKYHPGHSRSKEAKAIANMIAEAKLKYLGYTELKQR